MNPAPYTEDTLVQQTTAEYLEEQLGWQPVYAYNHEKRCQSRHSAIVFEAQRATSMAELETGEARPPRKRGRL